MKSIVTLPDRRAVVASIGAAITAAFAPGSFAATINDAAGRAVSTANAVTRVFPAGPPAAILLYTLAPELLLGWPRAQGADVCAYMLPDICGRPELGRLTGRGNTANFESVIALKPDLILDVGSTTATYVSLADRVTAQTGIPYVLLDGRFEATPDTYRRLGQLIGRPEQGEALARDAASTLSTTAERIASIAPAKRPRVYYARGPRGLETGLGGSINMEIIERLARNVAGESRGGLTSVSIEQVLLWNPDVIVTIDQTFAAAVRDDPAWRSVEAVRNGRVYLSPKLPFGWVDFPPSVNRLMGLWWLAKILYPTLFPEDIAALTRDFYKRYYHVDLTPAQIAHVLTGGD